MTTQVGALSHQAEIRSNIVVNSEFDVAYVVMNGLATVIACYGLFSNSPAVVIGAMIIAMLLGPISGVALGLVDRDNALLRKALGTLAGGVAVVFATAFVLGAIHSEISLTTEIYARTAPNLMDLMIALGGGAAGAFAMISPRLSVAFVGVAIATALVPPLSSSAICLARGEYSLASGAALLAFTNIVAIQVASSAVMWLGGFRGNWPTTPVSELKRNLLSAVAMPVALIIGSISIHTGHDGIDVDEGIISRETACSRNAVINADPSSVAVYREGLTFACAWRPHHWPSCPRLALLRATAN